jgi:hypothetical protein
VFGDAPDQNQFVLDGSFFIGVSKPHLTPDDGVGRLRGIPRLILWSKVSHAIFKMLTYY